MSSVLIFDENPLHSVKMLRIIGLSILSTAFGFLAVTPAPSQSLKLKLQQQDNEAIQKSNRCKEVGKKAQYAGRSYWIYVDPNGYMSTYANNWAGMLCNHNFGKVGSTFTTGSRKDSACGFQGISTYSVAVNEYVVENADLIRYWQSKEYFCNGGLKKEDRVQRQVFSLMDKYR